MRSEGRAMLDRYFGRLAEIAPRKEADRRSSQEAVDPARPVHSPSVRAVLSSVMKRLPLFIEQRRQLLSSEREAVAATTTMVGLTSKRLGVVPPGRTARSHVSWLLTGLPDTNTQSLAGLLENDRRVFFCDPVASSGFWEDSKQYWRDNVFIVDIGFLAFLLCTMPTPTIRALRRFCRHALDALLKGETPVVPVRLALTGCLLAEAYCVLLKGSTRAVGLMLTSNSFAVEVLRLALLEDGRCSSVIEILHGVPTQEYEGYLRTLATFEATSTGPAARHEVIGQLPGLPLDRSIRLRRGAVNTYFNRYRDQFGAAKGVQQGLREQVEQVLRETKISDEGLVVAVLGAMSNDNEDYLSSTVFQVELVILDLVATILSKADRKYEILYLPHPLNPISRFRPLEPFISGRARLHSDTPLGLLLADCCVGRISSALFESKYLGARVYTPIVEADRVYNPALLARLDDLPNESSLEGGLKAFLDECRHDSSRRLRERAEKRAEALWALEGVTIGTAMMTTALVL